MKRWTLTVVTVLLLGVWLASGRWEVGWSFEFYSHPVTVAVSQGCLAVEHSSGPSGGSFYDGEGGPWMLDDSGNWMDTGYTLRWLPAWEVWRWGPTPSTDRRLYVPLYLLAALTGSLAAFTWRKRLRRRGERVCGV